MEEERAAGAKGGRRYLRQGGTAAQLLDFPPVRNGIDYLASVVEHLDENEAVAPRDLKYAVLHLQAAAEVLLKARLLHEHWSLVFKDPGTANKKDFESAAFDSCGTVAAVGRLRDIAGITFDKKETDALDALAKDRNALQHYGLTHSAQAVEARAGRVLDFLIRFLEAELLPRLSEPERNAAARDMIPVMEGVKNISSYVKRRLDRLRGELKGLQSQIIRCPDCEQMTLVIAPGGGQCRFCGESWPHPVLLAADYLGDPFPEQLAQVCPRCDADILVQGVIFADAPDVADMLYCFSCAARYTSPDLAPCAGCGRPWHLQGSTAPLCVTCRENSAPGNAA